jgi:Do/DeqQ family serine protease
MNNITLKNNIVLLVGVGLVAAGAFMIGKSWRMNNAGPAGNVAYNREVVDLQGAFIGVADKVKPAVVSIYTEQVVKESVPFNYFFSDPFDEFFNDFFDGRPAPRQRPQRRGQSQYNLQKRMEGAGSGVIINKDGYILTNYHVVKNADKITVKLSSDKEYSGRVIGKDAKTDLAVVKIKHGGPFPVASLGDSDKIRVGEWAIAIGSPFGLEQTVTAGIISAKRQSMQIHDSYYRDLIQTDASINMGNSGGPLVNISGEVIGVNTAIYTQSGGSVGVGFAIPINRAKEILEPLMTKGKVERGYLGVGIKNVDDVIAKQSGLKETAGVLVESVMENTPADKAGIKRGDIILEFGNKKVDSSEKLQALVSGTAPDKKIDVAVSRNGERKVFTVMLSEWPEEASAGSREDKKSKKGEALAEWKGIKVSELTKDLMQDFNIDSSEEGVMILEIETGSKGEEMGLAAGDVIRSINRQKTSTLQEFSAAVKKVKLSDGILFDINRGGTLVYKTYIEK